MSILDRDWQQTFRLVTSPLRLSPDFIIAGEAKCGTTSLYRYIVSHPDVLPSNRKEPNNFIDYPGSMLRCRSHYPLKSIQWWRKGIMKRDSVTGEGSAEYFSRRFVPESIANNLPDVRVIVMLRNPVARALSDWNMLYQAGVLKDSFEDIVDRSIEGLSDDKLRPMLEDAGQIEHSSIRVVLRGIYVDSLRRWVQCFDDDHLRVYASEELFSAQQKTVDELWRFLDLGQHELSDLKEYRSANYDTGKHKKTLRKLTEFYAPFNEELFDVLGRKLPW